MYLDGATGRSMVKRFNVTSITRDREYPITKGTPKSKVLYFTANPNGEAEVVTIFLRASQTEKGQVRPGFQRHRDQRPWRWGQPGFQVPGAQRSN